MTSIEFEEEQPYQPRVILEVKKTSLTQLVVSSGIVSTEQQANYVLSGVAVLLFIISFVIPTFFSGPMGQHPTPSEIAAQMREAHNLR